MTSIASPSTSAETPATTLNRSERLYDLADELPAHPKLGRIVPELADPSVRECFLYSYRLIYELTGDTIHVLAVIHGKRLLESVERFGR